MKSNRLEELTQNYEALINRKNEICNNSNGIYKRYYHPVLTAEHAPLIWKYDFDEKQNPFMEERIGINAVMNTGAIKINHKYYLVARVEGADRKSFFAVAESNSPVDGFRFWDYPIEMPETDIPDTNMYDMRLTAHEDGWIYGVFCSESKDKTNPDLSAAVAEATPGAGSTVSIVFHGTTLARRIGRTPPQPVLFRSEQYIFWFSNALQIDAASAYDIRGKILLNTQRRCKILIPAEI